jgi:hypothetical protein
MRLTQHRRLLSQVIKVGVRVVYEPVAAEEIVLLKLLSRSVKILSLSVHIDSLFEALAAAGTIKINIRKYKDTQWRTPNIRFAATALVARQAADVDLISCERLRLCVGIAFNTRPEGTAEAAARQLLNLAAFQATSLWAFAAATTASLPSVLRDI